MQELEKNILELITKYPFFTDPIVLFNPKNFPGEEEILSGELNLEYPEIIKNLENLENIKNKLNNVIKIFDETEFDSNLLKQEFRKRLNDFENIIKLIEVFNNKDESKKYELVNSYFGIDFELLSEIFENFDLITSEFETKNKSLENKNAKLLEKLRNTFIKADGIKFYFEKALEFLKLENNWGVVIGDAVAISHVNFNAKGGDIIIPKDYEITGERLLQLIAHEIDGHCVQFSNSDFLARGNVRYSNSESLIEGFALYVQYSFMKEVFSDNEGVSEFIERNKLRNKYVNNSKKLDKDLLNLDNRLLRFFRGFKNTEEFKNLKDFVYIQGLYLIIKYKDNNLNILEILKKGTYNLDYIDRNFIKNINSCNCISYKEMSAYFILENYFDN